MPATLIAVTGNQIKVEVTVELSRSLLETEEAVQTALNQAGCLLTQQALHSLDTDGSPVVIGGEVWRPGCGLYMIPDTATGKPN